MSEEARHVAWSPGAPSSPGAGAASPGEGAALTVSSNNGGWADLTQSLHTPTTRSSVRPALRKRTVIFPEPGQVSWQWEHKSGFRDYEAASNAKIEYHYLRGDAKVRLKTGKQGSTPMEIFFIDMLQYDAVTGNSRRVRRVGDESLVTQGRRFLMEFVRSWETGQPRRQTFHRYKTRQQALVTVQGSFDVTALYSSRGWCAKIAKSSAFFLASTLLVFLNVVWIGVDVDVNSESQFQDAPAHFQVVEYLFFVCFAVELLIRFGAFARKCNAVLDLWFCYDALLVFFMFLETVFLPVLEALFGDGERNAVFRNATVLRTARLLKLARMTRLLRALPELMTMLRGIVAAFRSVVFTLLLELILVYTFGIVFTTWTRSHEMDLPYFTPLSRCMYSLLVHGTLMDEPSSPLNDMIAAETPTLVTLFLLFIVLSSFTVLNMLVGILFQVVGDVSAAEKLNKETDYLRYSLYDILECYDKEGDRTIGKEEFRVFMKNPEVHDVLQKFGTDAQDLVTLSDVLFEDTTAESDAGKLSFEELLQVVLRLRGEHAAHVTDIVLLREYLRQRMEDFKRELAKGQAEVVRSITAMTAPEPEARSTLVLQLILPDGSERKQLRKCTTTVAQVLAQLSAKRGALAAVSPAGLEVGTELTLEELASPEDGEVRLRLVPDTSSTLPLPL